MEYAKIRLLFSLGFLLGNLPEHKRLTISKEYVCGGKH